MTILAGQKIVLGVTGGIAAYKAPELVRQLMAAGAQVKVVLTRRAEQFVAPMALQALLGEPAFLAHDEGPSGMRHIELAKWATMFLIAPATANRIAQLALGLAEDLLGNSLLATAAPVVVCPAMNQQMYLAAATQQNLSTLNARGIRIVGPAWGEQACKDVGPGRMVNPDQIIEMLSGSKKLAGKRVVITAGPTRETIDPVRFISNRSSGKMGYALAEAFRDQGAEVELISGPTKLRPPTGLNFTSIETAQQMLSCVLTQVKGADLFVSVAAVADYAPKEVFPQKLKKQSDEWTLTLQKTPDILATVAGLPQRPLCIGFAAETHNGLAFARDKLVRKKIDMIAMNEVHNPQVGFDSNENALTLITANKTFHLPQQSKSIIAQKMVDFISLEFLEKAGTEKQMA